MKAFNKKRKPKHTTEMKWVKGDDIYCKSYICKSIGSNLTYSSKTKFKQLRYTIFNCNDLKRIQKGGKMKKLLSSIYEVDGKQQLSVWIEGQESEVMTFNVIDGKIERDN